MANDGNPLPGLDDMLMPELPSVELEARAFWRMRFRVLSAMAKHTFAHARLRLALIVGLSGGLWALLFWVFLQGFVFLRNTIPVDLHDQAVRLVFGMFFFTITAMLAISAGIILYSSLFKSRDVAFLLSLPVRVERVFLHKFQEAVLLSSWAFVLLGSPMLLAYGIVSEAPSYYFMILVPLLVAFTYIPAGVGATCCMLVVRYLPSGRALVLVLLVAATVAAAISIGWSLTANLNASLLTPEWFRGMLERLEFTEHRLLPSWWLSSSLLEAAENEWSESILFLTLMISNALFFRQVAIWTAAGGFRSGYSRLHGSRASERLLYMFMEVFWTLLFVVLGGWILAAAFHLVCNLASGGGGLGRRGKIEPDETVPVPAILPVQMRLLLGKDLKLFRRDPVQWFQFLIFFGLLALYFVNIHRFSYDAFYKGWVNMVSFLNVSVVGLLLSTFTTRFIFPMISLEGRRFWILGLLPLRRTTILWSKFVFAVGGSIVPCSLLIFLSDAMLQVSPKIMWSHQLTCVILCFGLSGIAVGLGARMPSLREDSPSRIAAGFGGTLNLVFSTLYIIVVILLTALPVHFQSAPGYGSGFLTGQVKVGPWLQFWFDTGTISSIVLGLAATIVPLWMGFRAFRKVEF